MSDQFLAEIRIFPLNFAPIQWAFCDGQLMPITQNTALFSLLGTTYGGDGRSTFALPNLQGATVMQSGQGNGLSLRDLGETAGEESIDLQISEIPLHTHALQASLNQGDNALVSPGAVLAMGTGGKVYSSSTASLVVMAPQGLPSAGGGLPHSNLQPYLTLNFCIALQGIFPPRS
jgi:microcystin-dependent protein